MKIEGSNSIVLYVSENTYWFENLVTKDQVNVRVKQDVGALGMHERNILVIGSFEGQGGFYVDIPSKGMKMDNKGPLRTRPYKVLKANGIITQIKKRNKNGWKSK